MALTPAQRTLRARAAAYRLHSRGLTNTAPARQKFGERFEHEVDPDGILEPTERAKRAEYARRAYFAELAFKSAQARQKRTS
jgi:hypothetical protein